MEKIIEDLKNLIYRFQREKLSGNIGIKVSFFKGGIANYIKEYHESKKLKDNKKGN